MIDAAAEASSAHTTVNSERLNEKALTKAFRKLKEEPLVPLGINFRLSSSLPKQTNP